MKICSSYYLKGASDSCASPPRQLSAHVRRNDFLRVRTGTTPDLASVGQKLKAAMATAGVQRVSPGAEGLLFRFDRPSSQSHPMALACLVVFTTH